ncbi:transposase-like protein [Candidatus Symbiobacter mobilis CR]|uniref:Transposase-like protein n=2 Tax=Candidatus Symbiobacter TaxID=1436289 RepID=U5N507_9BURK|nr:transposase-like protein [Candidatus Symbiobacter mobilis CR]
MALRMLVYLGLLYQDLIRRGEVLPNGRLPPVLPIVLYNGAARWTAATEFSELIPPVPGLVEKFKPKFQYLLIAKNHYTENTLPPVKNFVAALFRLEQVSSPEALLPLIASLQEWHENDVDVRRMFAIWIRATLMRKAPYQIQLPQVDDLQEISIMLSERIEEWAKGYEAKGMQVGIEQGMEQGLLQGRQQGMQQGMQQGLQTGMNQGQHLEAIRTLHKLLAKRFGDVPAALMARIEAASLEQIEGWFDFALDAPTLESVFADHTGAPLSH